MPKTFTICPNCEAIWHSEELEFQECDACGFPHQEDANNPDEEEIEPEWEDLTDGYVPIR
jgi:hypothetical protein